MPANPDAVAQHLVASPIEQQHIKEALEASQTAMQAIGTVTDISAYTLTILGVIIAVLALWGVGAVVRAAKAAAKQIANDRFNSYVKTDEFKEMIKERIAKSVDEKWSSAIVVHRLAEDPRDPADASPFPPPPKAGDAQ